MKKLVALFICVSLILVPCFAYADTASGSALTFDDQWLFSAGGIKPIEVASIEASTLGNDTKATTANTDVFINGYAMPSNMNFYYFGSGSQATTFSNAFSQLPYLFQAVTYSIAYSTQNLNTKIQTALTTLNTSVSGISTGVGDINSSSGQTAINTSNIYTRLGTMNTSLNNIKNYTDGVETALANILSAIQNQSFTVPQILLDNVQDIHDNQLTSSQFSNFTGWSDPTGTYTLARYRQVANGGSSSDLSPTVGARDTIHTLFYILNTYNTSAVYAFRDMLSGVSTNSTLSFKDYNLQDVSLGRQSLWYDVRLIGVNLNNSLSRLAFVLANDDEIAARQAAASNTAAAVSNVISSSGSGSAKPTDISGVADLKSSTTDSISSGVSASTIFSQTGSGGHAWDWFSQTVADELSAPSRRSNVRSNSKSSGSDTPMLDAYRHDLEEAIGFKLSW